MDMFNDFLKGFIRIRQQNREDFRNLRGDQDQDPPQPSDFERLWRERDDDDHDQQDDHDRNQHVIIIPNEHRGQFVFGNMFSMMGEMFQEMERSMADMDRFFTNEFNDNMPQPQQPQQPPSIFGNRHHHQHPAINPRDQMLKEGYVRPATSNKDKVDTDFDELTKSEGFDKLELPIPAKEKSNDEIQVYQHQHQPSCPKHGNSIITPRNEWNWNGGGGSSPSRFVYSFSQFNNRNGVVEGKEVKETSEGREVTTFKTNENGQVEKQTEFYPKDPSANPPAAPMLRDSDDTTRTDNDLLDSQSFFSKLFKPRM